MMYYGTFNRNFVSKLVKTKTQHMYYRKS